LQPNHPEVAAHNADVIGRSYLLKLLARCSQIAGEVMNGAYGSFFFCVDSKVPMKVLWNCLNCLKREMRTGYPRGLEYHAFRIIWIYAPVGQNAVRVDHINVKVKAASSTAQTEHAAKMGCEDL